jgi:FkbM family methyltransferase
MDRLRTTYWKLRETLPEFLATLKADPPLRRLDRFVKTRCRHTLRINDIAIRLAPEMGSAAVSYMLDGRYEKPERRILEYALTPEDCVLELGTGIGYLSAFCARMIGSDRVFTFEANPLLRRQIEETYSINKVSPQVEFCMLGEQAGEASFYVAKEFWSSSTISRKGKGQCIKIPVKAFNDVLAEHRPNFLIIDIEGGEADLISFMRLDGVTKVCIELHPWVIGKESEKQVRAFFHAHGFREDPLVSDDEHIFYRRT